MENNKSSSSVSICLPGEDEPDSINPVPITVSIVEDNLGTRTNLVALLGSEPRLRIIIDTRRRT